MTEKNTGPKVATIIVTYNGAKWIEGCLNSLEHSSYPTTIYVVDNQSTDTTVALIEQHFPTVNLIKNPVNTGFGQANNLGMKRAIEEGAEYLFLMNQDATIESTALNELVVTAFQQRKFGIISPVHMNGSGSELDFGFAHYCGCSSYGELMNKTGHKSIVEVSFVNAAFWLIPTNVLQQIGGFDSLFFYCGEDVDVVNRMKYHGYKVGFVPRAIACHDRENRPTPPKKVRQLNIIAHLAEHVNCNYSNFEGFLYGELGLWKRAVSALVKLRWKDFWAYKLASIHLFFQLRTINRHRRIAREGNVWKNQQLL